MYLTSYNILIEVMVVTVIIYCKVGILLACIHLMVQVKKKYTILRGFTVDTHK